MGKHKVIDLNQEIPLADSTENFLLRDVVGNKTDTAAIPSNTTSVIAGIKKVYNEIVSITIAGELFYISSPANLEIDDIGNYNIGLYDVGDGIPTSAEITAGNYQIDRVRNGVLTNIVTSTGASKADGRIYCSETFDAASGWATGDLVLVTFSGGSVTPTGGSTTILPSAYLYSRIVRGETIEGYTKKIYDETFGVSPVDGSLASFIATGGTALGTRLPASKSLYDVIALDRLDNGTYGLSAIETELNITHDIVAKTGTVYFVGKGGNDANDAKSWDNRRLTVASGYGLCLAGDSLIIGAGVYVENVTFDTGGVYIIGHQTGYNNSVTLHGNAVVSGAAHRFENIVFYDTDLSVMTVTGSYNETWNCRIGGAGSVTPVHIDLAASFNIFNQCNMYEGSSAAVLIDGGANVGNIFRNCRIRPAAGVAHGVHTNHASVLRTTLLNCTIVGTGSTGTGIYFQLGTHNIASGCFVDDITTPYNIAANNYIVGCHEGSLIATNSTTENDLKAIYDDVAVVDTVVDAIKVETDKLTGGEYVDTATAGTSGETTIKEITPVTKRTEIKSIWLDLTLLVTAGATIKMYHKIDGTNYRVFETDSWALSDDDGVLINGFVINNDFKITLTGGEAAGVNIPYNIVYQTME